VYSTQERFRYSTSSTSLLNHGVIKPPWLVWRPCDVSYSKEKSFSPAPECTSSVPTVTFWFTVVQCARAADIDTAVSRRVFVSDFNAVHRRSDVRRIARSST